MRTGRRRAGLASLLLLAAWACGESGTDDAENDTTLDRIRETWREQRDAFVAEYRERVAGLSEDLADLRARAAAAGAEFRAEHADEIAALEERREALARRIDELADRAGEEYERLRQEAVAQWRRLEQEVDELKAEVEE